MPLSTYYAYVGLNIFRAPLCPSSGAHDELWLPHRPSGSRVAAGWRLSAGRMDGCPEHVEPNISIIK